MSAEQKVLIIDDEPDIRELLEITLLRMGLSTKTAPTVQDGMLAIQSFKPDLVLTDMQLPDGTGVDIVNYLQRDYANTPVAVITAFGSMETAVEVLKAGAFDYVSKPVDVKKLRNLVQTALSLTGQVTPNKATPAGRKTSAQDIIGDSFAMDQMKAMITKLSRSQAPVFIQGESGTGKELVSKQIHIESPRANGPFVPVNCGAIPESLMESEFFGHKKGSFTGAVDDKDGLFQAASGGTLFLDEVADLPLDMQVKLLRVIQEKAVKPIGAVDEVDIDVRILSATHKDLEALVESGKFRQDLYYRLNVIKLEVPSLRERGDDILMLADFFIEKIAVRWGTEAVSITPPARQALLNYAFPGNVRELENILERASTLCDDNKIEIADLHINQQAEPFNTFAKDSAVAAAPHVEADLIDEPVHEGELQKILETLHQTRWNRTNAAEKLGMSVRQLRYRIKKYGLEDEA